MNIKQLLIPTALASSFALGIYTSQGTKQLLTSIYNTIEQTIEQYTSLDLPHLPTPQPSYSPTSQPSSSSTAQQHHSSTPPSLPDPQLQQKMLQLEQQNAALKQKLYTQTPTLPTAQPQQPSQHNYTPRARELSAHDLAQPFLMAFANKTQHFLGQHLDQEQQAFQLYNQLANNLDILAPSQRRDIAARLEENDTRWLTPQQQTERLYEKTKQSLGKLPDEKRASLDQLLHLSNPELTTPCLAFNPLSYLQNLLTLLTYTSVSHLSPFAYPNTNPTATVQNSDIITQPNYPTAPLPHSLPTELTITLQPSSDYDKIISEQIQEKLLPQIQQQYHALEQTLAKKIKQAAQKITKDLNCRLDTLESKLNIPICTPPSLSDLPAAITPSATEHSPTAAPTDTTPTTE